MASEVKEKGNAAFKDGDYAYARDCYTEAMRLDPTEFTYPLNRAFVNLKLEKWEDAENDATTTLALDPRNLKAYFRRSIARREQGNFSGAREDIKSFKVAGGDRSIAIEHHDKIAAAEASTVMSTKTVAYSDDEPGFVVSESSGKGLGVFASRPFRRGDLILAEHPLYVVESFDNEGISAAVARLSPASLAQFSALHNAHSGDFPSDVLAIHASNSFAAGDTQSVLCPRASRFNHSCLPNARYSWHASGRCLRIYALQDIAVGEELCVSYISGRGVYGSAKQARQAQLSRYGFLCACVGCTLPEEAQAASDRRREEVARIWEMVPYYSPRQTALRLHSIARAVHLLQEEGYAADADDFTNDAAAICACHSDWASADYWARKTYETRVAEFGEDSERVAEIQLDLRNSPAAGTQRRQVFNIRL